jgi:hypothetical protein
MRKKPYYKMDVDDLFLDFQKTLLSVCLSVCVCVCLELVRLFGILKSTVETRTLPCLL